MPVTVVSSLPPVPSPAVGTNTPLAAWACAVAYSGDQGLRQMPTCGPFGTMTRIVRKHGGKATKVIRWVAMGWGGKPPLPSFDTQCANEVLAYWEIGEPAQGKWIDGQDAVAVIGQYTYFLQKIPNLSIDYLAFCTAPWASTPSLSVYSLSNADFNKLFVGPSYLPGGFNGGLIGF